MTSPSANVLAKQHLWRTDITGLRALAVLPVLLFHAFPALCPGGFLGVDIFFVISGYLISGIIFRGMLSDSFSYSDFYAKRIRRIIPNLVLVLAFVAVVGYFFLFAYEYQTLGKHIYSSAAFYQNFRLLRAAGDYFANDSVTQPLLHLWSLAIEEQFYIVFPLIATLIWWISKRSVVVIGAMVATIVLGSFAGCLLTKNASYAFYFPLTRFWEIGVGMVLAYVETFRFLDTRRIAIELRNCVSVCGFLLIVGAMWFYTTDIVTPGWYSLLPVLGTAFLIAAHEDSVVNRTVLTWKAMIFVGLISYSLYLWHWPLISYLHIINPKPEDWMIILALVFSFVLSVLVYVGVENPMRRYKGIPNKYIVATLIVCLTLCYGFGKIIKDNQGFKTRSINENFKEFQTFTDWTYPGILQEHEVESISLYVSDKTKFPEILFIGDSHVEQYAERAVLLAKRTGKSVAFLTRGGCFAPVAYMEKGDDKRCRNIPKSFEKLLQDSRLKTVVWGQMWGYYNTQTPALFEKGLDVMQAWISKNPGRNYFVLLDYPWDDHSYDIRNRFVTKRWSEISLDPSIFVVDYPYQTDWRSGNLKVIQKLEKVKFIETETKVCPNKKCNLLKSYKDDDHLRASYVKEHATWIDQVFE